MGNAIGSPTVKCFRFVCENLTAFPFGKRIVGKLDLCAFWRYIRDIFGFNIQVGVYETLSRGLLLQAIRYSWIDVSSPPPTARTAFRLRMLPLDATCTLKYNTLISVHAAHIPQKYNTYTTYPRALMTARSLADVRDAALFPNYFGQTCFDSPCTKVIKHIRGDTTIPVF